MNIHEREVMQRALEALEGGLWDYGPGQDEHDKCNEVITALREALKPNREGKYYYKDNACTADSADSPDCICWHDKALAEQACPNGCDTSNGRCVDCPDYVAEQAEQEPVAEVRVRPLQGYESTPKIDVKWLVRPTPGFLYAAPVRTKDLTDDEIDEIGKSYFDEWSFGFARAVIAADREKNLIK